VRCELQQLGRFAVDGVSTLRPVDRHKQSGTDALGENEGVGHRRSLQATFVA
jgi:hypothetical protein